jgi:hypothetical protein
MRQHNHRVDGGEPDPRRGVTCRHSRNTEVLHRREEHIRESGVIRLEDLVPTATAEMSMPGTKGSTLAVSQRKILDACKPSNLKVCVAPAVLLRPGSRSDFLGPWGFLHAEEWRRTVELVVAAEEHRVGEDAALALVDEGGAQDLRDMLKLHDEDELAAGRRAATVSLATTPAEPDVAVERRARPSQMP